MLAVDLDRLGADFFVGTLHKWCCAPRGTGIPGDNICNIANWAEVKAQARTMLGIRLTDSDVFDVPLILTDPYGHFKPGPNGFPRLVLPGNVLLEGNADLGRPDVSMNHGVVRIAAGVAWSADWGTVTFSLVQDSREFDTQRAMQRFGILAVHLGFL